MPYVRALRWDTLLHFFVLEALLLELAVRLQLLMSGVMSNMHAVGQLLYLYAICVVETSSVALYKNIHVVRSTVDDCTLME